MEADDDILQQINTIPRPSFFENPQNAQENVLATDAMVRAEEEVRKQGMQRIDGILVPAEIAQRRTRTPSKDRCSLCQKNGSTRQSRNREGLLQVTMCEVRQHATLDDCWITCKGYVYNATTFMREMEHPGGERSFLRRAGGIVDCAEDFAFHSAKGRRLWSKYRIAVILRCDDKGEDDSGFFGCIIS